MTIKEKVKKAQKAIDAVFSDTSGPVSANRSALEELQSDIEMALDSLPDD